MPPSKSKPSSPKPASRVKREDYEREQVRALYTRHAGFVARNLKRLGVPPSRIEDAMQEVFLVAHRRFHDYDPSTASERTWLFGIALRVAGNELRAGRRRRARVTERESGFWLAVPDASGAPDQLALAREAVALMAQALALLSVEQRHIWTLVELESLPVPEAAKSLNLKLNTAYGRLRAARAQVRRALHEFEAELDAPRSREQG